MARRRTGCDACAGNFVELRVKLYDIKDFPTEGIFFAAITTLLEDGRPSGAWATSCPTPTSTNPSRWWRRWSRATSVVLQPLTFPLVASPLWRLRQSSGVGATVRPERTSEA